MMRNRFLVVIVMALMPSISTPPGAVDYLGGSGTDSQDFPLVPFWNNEALAECNTNICLENYPGAANQEEYNECYACICLAIAAENPGELSSAQAQCQWEQSN